VNIKNVKSFPFTCLIILAALSAVSAKACLTSVSENLINIMVNRFGSKASTNIKAWQRSELKIPKVSKDYYLPVLEQVNNLVNKIPYSSDPEIWDMEDYWATPAEFVSVNLGDCDDYVVAKYFTLIAHGIPLKRLRIVYVRAFSKSRVGSHLVLAYYPDDNSEPLVLDNIRHTLLPVSKRPDLTPVYSFNDEHLYRELPSGTRTVGTASMVRLWGDLKMRMNKEKQQ